MELRLLPSRLAIVRLDPAGGLPAWAQQTTPGEFRSVTWTERELSLVVAERRVPPSVARSGGWRALEVAGPLDLSLVGILHSLLGPLAAASVPVFPIATHDTDYLLVPEDRLDAAIRSLSDAGHSVARAT